MTETDNTILPRDWYAEPTCGCSSTPALMWAKWYRVRRAITALSKLAREYNGPPSGFDDAATMVLAIIDNGHMIPQLPSGAFDSAMLASEVCHA